MNAPVLPTSLIENPRLDRWIHFQPDRTVRIATGKVEMGQGIVTAIDQIAAEELDLPLDRVAVMSGNTTHGPDELYTTSSLSVDVSGGSVRLVCAEVRAKALERAALRLNCSREELTVVDGRFLQNGAATGQDYWTVAAEIDLTQNVTGMTPPKPVAGYKVVGQSVPRVDLPAKISGAAFVHDVLPADVLHARTLRQPHRGASLASLDETAIRRAAKGELQIVRETNFVAFVSPVESVAQAAAVAAPLYAKWDNVRRLIPEQQEAAWLKGQPSDDRHIGAPAPSREAGATPPRNLVQATFSRPYIAHASMAPSCALAEFRDGHLTVRSHGQGMHPLRVNLAAALGLPIDAI
ncbi:MAG: molybdopterin-dependent oxidoreductase, partial [Reyranella sp.]|nr:molybdopterin-dependent oxidoreductase [Reyranella sp.]